MKLIKVALFIIEWTIYVATITALAISVIAIMGGDGDKGLFELFAE